MDVFDAALPAVERGAADADLEKAVLVTLQAVARGARERRRRRKSGSWVEGVARRGGVQGESRLNYANCQLTTIMEWPKQGVAPRCT